MDSTPLHSIPGNFVIAATTAPANTASVGRSYWKKILLNTCLFCHLNGPTYNFVNMHARPLALLIDGAGYVDIREKRGLGDKWQQPCICVCRMAPCLSLGDVCAEISVVTN